MGEESQTSYSQIFFQIENLLKKSNRLKDQPALIKTRYESLASYRLDETKPIVVIFGEQHSGANTNNINFAKSNRALLNTLVTICEDKDLPVKSFIKEGCSKLEPYEKLGEKTVEELLLLGLSPLQVYVNKINPKMEVKTVESLEIFLDFALLSFLYASRPGNARFSEIEMQRIMYIIADGMDYDKYILVKARTMKLQEDLKLFEFIDQKYVKKVKFETDFGELELLALRSNIEEKVSEEAIQQFDLRIGRALFDCGKARDHHVAETISKFEPGVYPMFFGEYHVDNLIKAFAELKVGLIVLSPFS